MRVGSPEDCCRDPPVVTQPPTSSATEESEGAPPLTAGLAAHRPTKHPLEHLYKYKCKGDLLQVVNAPGGSGKTLALATLLAEQEEIRSRSASASWCPSLAARHERHQDDVNKHGKRSHFTMTTLVRNLARCC